MVRHITQYNGRIFSNGLGWDGAQGGGYSFFTIKKDNHVACLVGDWEGDTIYPVDWFGKHLNSFRLELVYE